MVCNAISIPSDCVYLSTRVMKHAYDKRTARDYDLLIDNLVSLLESPDRIYKNKESKRGLFCFVKDIKNSQCLCSIEVSMNLDLKSVCEVVTFFIPGNAYLRSFELLWEWKGGASSS